LVQGHLTGQLFPAYPEPLRDECAGFLTRAFHAMGTLAPENRVTAVTHFEEFFGGGAGRKLVLTVDYADPRGLHRELFVKYPRDFGDPLRDLFAGLMDAETRFAHLSRRPGFPVPVPRCYFADYDPSTGTGVLITERIAFGRDGIEPFQDKCLDYELADPAGHYRALVLAVARLSGAYKAGRLGDDVDAQFPFDPAVIRTTDRIPYTAEQLEAKIERLRRFAQEHPSFLPEHLRAGAFLDQFGREAHAFLAREIPIKRFLQSNPDYIALGHWNANVDNAWFQAGPDGQREAGLLDWGGAGRMNVAQTLFGVLCAAELDIWDRHKDELVRLFASEYHRSGGPRLPIDDLHFQVRLFIAMLGLAWMLDAPNLIEMQLPDLGTMRDRYDPRFRENFLARAQLHLMTVFLNAWQTERFGDLLEQFDRLPGLA
jgi:hypothetical protein